jgi:hypothetical protein
MADVGVFFAEDVFGVQFVLRDNGVFTFDPETGNLEWMATDLEDWAGRILGDFAALSGYALAHEWQEHHGPIPVGVRLTPKTPFVLGGEYSMENLHPLEAVQAMRLRGAIALQIRDLPDGARVKLQVSD